MKETVVRKGYCRDCGGDVEERFPVGFEPGPENFYHTEDRDCINHLKDENLSLREALVLYGYHDPGCDTQLHSEDQECNCGFRNYESPVYDYKEEEEEEILPGVDSIDLDNINKEVHGNSEREATLRKMIGLLEAEYKRLESLPKVASQGKIADLCESLNQRDMEVRMLKTELKESREDFFVLNDQRRLWEIKFNVEQQERANEKIRLELEIASAKAEVHSLIQSGYELTML